MSLKSQFRSLVIITVVLINSANAQIPYDINYDDGTHITGTYQNDPKKIPAHMFFISPFNAVTTGEGAYLGYNLQHIYRTNSFFHSVARIRGGYFRDVNGHNKMPSMDAMLNMNLRLINGEKDKEKFVSLHWVRTGNKSSKAYVSKFPMTKRKTLNLSCGMTFIRYATSVEVDVEIEPFYYVTKYAGSDMSTLASSFGIEYESLKGIRVDNNYRNYHAYSSFKLYAHGIYGFVNQYQLYEESNPGQLGSVLIEKTDELNTTLDVIVKKFGMRLGIERFGHIYKMVGFVIGFELYFAPQYIIQNTGLKWDGIPANPVGSSIGGFNLHVGLTLGKDPW